MSSESIVGYMHDDAVGSSVKLASSRDVLVQLADIVRTLPYHAKTLLLFTKSDIKTIVLPIAIFSLSLASRTSPSGLFIISRLPAMLWWTWYTLLLFNLGNQTQPYSLDEDSVNKPWRPIPAGRISLKNAKILEQVLLVAVHVVSAIQGVFFPALFLYLLGHFYNSMGGHRSALGRNIICSFAYAGFGYGACRILESRGELSLQTSLSYTDSTWVALYASIVFCTIQVADLGDIEGDEMLGRRTLPIIFGERNTKLFSAAGVIVGSEIVRRFWAVSEVPGTALLAGGAIVGGLVSWGEYHGWKNSYAWYCVWLMGIGIVPMVA